MRGSFQKVCTVIAQSCSFRFYLDSGAAMPRALHQFFSVYLKGVYSVVN